MNRILKIKNKNEFELIERIIIGFSLLSSLPSEGWYSGEEFVEQDLLDADFSPEEGKYYYHTGNITPLFPGNGIYYYNGSKYISFYINSGTKIIPEYTILTTSETFVANTFYAFDPISKDEVDRKYEPNGTPYDFRACYATLDDPVVGRDSQFYYAHFGADGGAYEPPGDILYEYYFKNNKVFWGFVLDSKDAIIGGMSPANQDFGSGISSSLRYVTHNNLGRFSNISIKSISFYGGNQYYRAGQIIEIYAIRS